MTKKEQFPDNKDHTGKNRDDASLFRDQMRGVKPLRQSDRVDLKIPNKIYGHSSDSSQSTKARKQLTEDKLKARQRAVEALPEQRVEALTSREYIDQVKPHDTLSFMRSGLQHNTFKKLRLGKLFPEAELDLHGHTVEQARGQLLDFIEACFDEGIRIAIVTHGHGDFRKNPALLKSCVNRWLQEIERVMAFHTALPKHGGSGATYVLVRQRKSESYFE